MFEEDKWQETKINDKKLPKKKKRQQRNPLNFSD